LISQDGTVVKALSTSKGVKGFELARRGERHIAVMISVVQGTRYEVAEPEQAKLARDAISW